MVNKIVSFYYYTLFLYLNKSFMTCDQWTSDIILNIICKLNRILKVGNTHSQYLSNNICQVVHVDIIWE